MRFADTNIHLYAISTIPEEQPKALIAIQLLDSNDLGLSVQVLVIWNLLVSCILEF